MGVTIPFPNPRPPKDAKYKLQFERPSSINATGSYPLKTATKTDDGLVIDLVVTMPRPLLQEKDYLNHRYFYKRAYYLACVAAGIKVSKEHKFRLSFHCLNGNQLQPIIVVCPHSDGGVDEFSSSKCRIHVLVALPENTFAQGKILPTSNCVRSKGVNEVTSKQLSPTPFYNSTLQSDRNIIAYLKLLHATSVKCYAFKDACILGRIWLKQRGFGGRLRKGGFGNFEWAVIMALLLQPTPGSDTSPLSPGYSSYQLFKATLQFLARHDLSKKAFSFQARDVILPQEDNTPIFFDGPRGLNVLFKMTPWSYSRLQIEAKTTTEMLSDSVFDYFDSTFILKTDILSHLYDATLEIPLSTLGLDSASQRYDEELTETSRKVYRTLLRALTDRVTSINFILPDDTDWSISSHRPLENQAKRILVNFAIDPTNANRTVDHGPPAENKQEAVSFRTFWGDKAELRRFKDGSILESVVWSPVDYSTSIMEQIIFYILGKHINAQLVDKAHFTCDTFAHLITSGRMQGHSGVASFLPTMNALATLEQDIRTLEGLPLQIRHIRAADPQLRYSSTEPSASGSHHTPPSIVLQFEGSARWPDDLCAIQRTKIAFLLKLSELLATSQSSCNSRVGLENPSQPSQNQAYLDIYVPSGSSFRLRIHHDREATLLDRQLKDTSLDAQSRESAASALALYRRTFLEIPAHTQVVQTLCTRFPALSPAIRLTKTWFDSHLLSPHIAPELIELLVMRTFLQPYPWPVPSCATTGFLRTLAWISRWDWRHVPLIVDFSSTFTHNSTDLESSKTGGMKPEDIKKIQTRFEAWRQIDPAMNRVVLFAATNMDTEGTTWTDRGQPERVVAARMTALAKAATYVVRAKEDSLLVQANARDKPNHSNGFAPESLFASQIQDYDIIIDVSPKYTRSSKKKQEPKFKNLEIQQSSTSSQTVPISYAKLFADDLRTIYGDAVLWFWNPENLNRIVGLWNPVVTGRRSWKIKAGWNSLPVRKKKTEDNGDVDIQVNKGAILNEIRRLGGDLITRIEINK